MSGKTSKPQVFKTNMILEAQDKADWRAVIEELLHRT